MIQNQRRKLTNACFSKDQRGQKAPRLTLDEHLKGYVGTPDDSDDEDTEDYDNVIGVIPLNEDLPQRRRQSSYTYTDLQKLRICDYYYMVRLGLVIRHSPSRFSLLSLFPWLRTVRCRP